MSKRGTFLVTAADEGSAVLRDVDGGQVHTLASNPGVEEGDVLEATVAPEPPLEVTWTVTDVDARRSIRVERVADRPTGRAREAGRDLAPGDVVALDSDEGETHVIAVPVDRTDEAAAEVAGDEGTLERAAAIGAERVTVRAADGVVSVRYR